MRNFSDFVNRFTVEYYDRAGKCIGVETWSRESCLPRIFNKFLSERPDIFFLTCEKYGCRQFVSPLFE